MQHLKPYKRRWRMENRDIEIMSGKTDERCQGDWKSRYMEKKVHIIQIIEAIYLLLIVIVSFVTIFLNYTGVLEDWLKITDVKQLYFSRMLTCVTCGLLGGGIFDMKWFYKSIAHGFWNLDRIYWRIFTPIISMAFAFCMACIFSDNIIIHGDGFSASTLGFLAGYFSDEAVGKMAEVAKVVFNTNKKSSENVKENK